MERLAFETVNVVGKNIEKILELFPNTATEKVGENGELKRAINFEKLKQELSEVVIDGEESYDFTWVGKKEAMVEANKPIRKTLRPDRNSSVDWENTQNIYIEGDNLEALKLLQESYLGKVKMIYIDPPYNTGKDFIYRDNFTQDKESYENELGTTDEEGNRLFQNTESNGRFHSDWCSMIYPRLKLARNLLSEDGVIFISIDDNEVRNLKNICDEVFGEDNFISSSVIINNRGGRDYGGIAKQHEYLIVYSKSPNKSLNLIEEKDKAFQYKDEIGGFNLMELRNRNVKFNINNRPNLCYPFYLDPNTKDANGLYKISLEEQQGYIKVMPAISQGVQTVWRWGKEEKARKNLNIEIFGKDNQNGGYMIVQKYRKTTKMQRSIWDEKEFVNERGTETIKELFQNNYFDYPKSPFLLKRILELNSQNNDLILDFFSGSATTAHAIMQLNAEDRGKRKFIMVQLPELCDEQSEAYKAGYKNICEIGKERIRRAGKKIFEEWEEKYRHCKRCEAIRNNETGLPRAKALAMTSLRHCERSEAIQNNEIAMANKDCQAADTPFDDRPDVGFRVFKVDDTNMKDIYYSPKNYNQNLLDQLESNIKEDRTDEDLLYGILLDWGVELSLPHRVETVESKKVHIVNDDDLIACFEDEVPDIVVRYIANLKPTRAVFKDSSFKTDDYKINVEEIFKLISPDTTVKVI